VRVGSLSDPIELPGLAHFLEHMLFYSNEKYPEEDAYSKFIARRLISFPFLHTYIVIRRILLYLLEIPSHKGHVKICVFAIREWIKCERRMESVSLVR